MRPARPSGHISTLRQTRDRLAQELAELLDGYPDLNEDLERIIRQDVNAKLSFAELKELTGSEGQCWNTLRDFQTSCKSVAKKERQLYREAFAQKT